MSRFGNQLKRSPSVPNISIYTHPWPLAEIRRWKVFLPKCLTCASRLFDFVNIDCSLHIVTLCSIVPRVIAGGLSTRVDIVSLSGFDTRATQADEPRNLLLRAVAALEANGIQQHWPGSIGVSESTKAGGTAPSCVARQRPRERNLLLPRARRCVRADPADGSGEVSHREGKVTTASRAARKTARNSKIRQLCLDTLHFKKPSAASAVVSMLS